MPKLNTTTSGIITATLTADSTATLELQQNGVAIRTLGESQLVMGTAQSTATGATLYDFSGIPSWAKRITVIMNGLSTSGTSALLVQIGDSGGIETTGYVSGVGVVGTSSAAGSSSTAGFLWSNNSVAAGTLSGTMTIQTPSLNVWVSSSAIGYSVNGGHFGGGNKTLSDTLTQVRVTTVNGTDTFDAGTVNIMWE